MPRTLAFAKFKVSLEAEIRTFWHILSCQEYASRWLNSISPQPAHLSSYAGDSRNPFKSIDLSVPDFLSHSEFVQACVRENAVVSFITAFESFLFETLERLIYIDPALINDSSIQIEAKELCLVTDQYIRRWLATKVADKYLRNMTHREMITKVDKFAKSGVSKHSEVEEWAKWSLVRNAVVHTSRFVTNDLSEAWPERFRTVGEPLKLTDKEVAHVHHLALTISSAIDERAVASTIKDSDAKVLVKELFIQQGVDNPREIRNVLNRVLNTSISVPNIEKLIADQRKAIDIDHWNLSHGDLQKILT